MRRLVELASKQFGVVTCADLGCTEVSWKWLRGRLATREWNRVHRGVFRLGCNQPGRDEREMAALLAAGQGAVLSHTSAARRLGLAVPPRDWDDVVREPDTVIEGLLRSFEVAGWLSPRRPEAGRAPWRDGSRPSFRIERSITETRRDRWDGAWR